MELTLASELRLLKVSPKYVSVDYNVKENDVIIIVQPSDQTVINIYLHQIKKNKDLIIRHNGNKETKIKIIPYDYETIDGLSAYQLINKNDTVMLRSVYSLSRWCVVWFNTQVVDSDFSMLFADFTNYIINKINDISYSIYNINNDISNIYNIIHDFSHFDFSNILDLSSILYDISFLYALTTDLSIELNSIKSDISNILFDITYLYTIYYQFSDLIYDISSNIQSQIDALQNDVTNLMQLRNDMSALTQYVNIRFNIIDTQINNIYNNINDISHSLTNLIFDVSTDLTSLIFDISSFITNEISSLGFLDLTDTPNDYSQCDKYILSVDESNNSIIFQPFKYYINEFGLQYGKVIDITADYSANTSKILFVNPRLNQNINIYLPSDVTIGDFIRFINGSDYLTLSQVIIIPTGNKKIMGSADSMHYNMNVSFVLIYYNDEFGQRIGD